MEPSAEINRLILSLLHELKIYKAKSLAQNSAFVAISKMLPDQRAKLTLPHIHDLEQDARRDAFADVNAECAQLEQALSSGSDVLHSLDSFLRKRV
jgi:hypothetical protein